MIYLIAVVVLQIVCAAHVIRNGRDTLWLLAIIFFSLLGCLAYLVIEVLPAYGGNRYVRHARAQVGARINPERDLRAALDALELADTAANRIAVGDALTGLNRNEEAATYYRQAVAMSRGSDHATTFKLAQAEFASGRFTEALRLLDGLSDGNGSVADKRNHLRARALAETGQDAEARALFEDVMTRLPGDEARCHYAHFLLERGDRRRAREVLEDVHLRAKRMDRLQRAEAADMYRWAESQLSNLRAG